MKHHNRDVLPITIADSADKDIVDTQSAQPTPLDRTFDVMSLLTRIYA